jgi:hypothetical protein
MLPAPLSVWPLRNKTSSVFPPVFWSDLHGSKSYLPPCLIGCRVTPGFRRDSIVWRGGHRSQPDDAGVFGERRGAAQDCKATLATIPSSAVDRLIFC